MASAEMIRVYVGERGKRGYFHPVIGRLPRDKVIRFSALAARIPAEHGSLIFPGYANISAVKRILRWIDENDAGSCRPLEAESDEFAESVILLSTANILDLDSNLRGNVLRDKIRHYLCMAPLTANEFAMVMELLGRGPGADTGMQNLALQETAKWRVGVDGRRHGVPEWAQIEAYCKANGLWEKRMHGFLRQYRLSSSCLMS